MTPIINPKIFYWIDVLADTEMFFCVIMSILLFVIIGGVFAICLWYFTEYSEEFESDIKLLSKLKKYLIKTFVVFVIVVSLILVIPSKETIYTMLIAKYTTKDNVQMVTEQIKGTVDYIFEKIDNE